MYRKMLAAALVLFAAGAGQAAEVAPGDVIAAVETFVRQVSADARPEARVAELQPHRIDGRIVAYVAHLAGGGFCIAGADDRLVPVAAYAPKGSYDPACPGNRWTLDDLAVRLARFEEAEAANDPILAEYRIRIEQRRRDWLSLSARQRPPSRSSGLPRDVPSQLTLPVSSWWHQKAPFNTYCPVLPPPSPGMPSLAVVGCVATASAQIMYYWQWPPHGVGWGTTTHVYYHTTVDLDFAPLATDPGPFDDALVNRLWWTDMDGGQLVMCGYWDWSLRHRAELDSADPAYRGALATLFSRQVTIEQLLYCDFTVAYDWALMQDVAQDPPGPAEQQMARISYNMAVAAESGFGLLGTGSDQPRAVAALKDHFRYHPDAYNATMNLQETVLDIQWLRPVQMSGPGHSWVVCGYNTQVSPWQFLMNYGWGRSPVWATVDDMFPGHHDFIRYIAPVDVVRFVGNTVFGDGSPSIPYRDLAVAAAYAPTGCTLIFRAGSDNPFAASILTLDRPMTLKGVDVRIRPQ